MPQRMFTGFMELLAESPPCDLPRINSLIAEAYVD